NYNPQPHDEYRFRLERPELKRRPRGDYNTFRLSSEQQAEPFGAGWTGSMLVGGSVIWGAWSFRALPIDYRLNTHFKVNNQLAQLEAEGYSIPCRMGDDPTQSVLDRYCRLHDVPNVFVVDSSFMPTGFGLNPMVTVVANALRVATWIVEQSKSGDGLS